MLEMHFLFDSWLNGWTSLQNKRAQTQAISFIINQICGALLVFLLNNASETGKVVMCYGEVDTSLSQFNFL